MSDKQEGPSSARRQHRESFIDKLIQLQAQDDRAKLAVLRRSLMDFGHDFSAFRIIGEYLPKGGPSARHDMYLLTAGLFALHGAHFESRDSNKKRSLGDSVRISCDPSEVGKESLDQRFAALLNSKREDLPHHLRHLFSLLKAREVSVDYRVLLDDLVFWESLNRRIQRKWARDYWTVISDEFVPPDTSPVAENTALAE